MRPALGSLGLYLEWALGTSVERERCLFWNGLQWMGHPESVCLLAFGVPGLGIAVVGMRMNVADRSGDIQIRSLAACHSKRV